MEFLKPRINPAKLFLTAFSFLLVHYVAAANS